MLFEVKNVISPKPSIIIKIRLHYRVPCNKLFKTRPHMNIFWQNFLTNIYLMMNLYLKIIVEHYINTVQTS
jgi:hypothetical protein